MIRCAYCSSLVTSNPTCSQCGGPLGAGAPENPRRERSLYDDPFRVLLDITKGAQNPQTIRFERIETNDGRWLTPTRWMPR